MPRIISGENKGMRLYSLDTNDTRPTMDRIKESVFNIIQNKIYDCKILDMYAGTGQIGIEALARGAKWANFVEKNVNAGKIIEKNLKKTGFDKRSNLYIVDSLDYLENICDEKYDIIYIDPPYFEKLYDKTIEMINKKNILSENGIIITEHDSNVVLYDEYGNIKLIRIKKYGKTRLRIYGKRD